MMVDYAMHSVPIYRVQIMGELVVVNKDPPCFLWRQEILDLSKRRDVIASDDT